MLVNILLCSLITLTLPQASTEFRTKVSLELIPRLRTFTPDILFISAGFDGHQGKQERGNCQWVLSCLSCLGG